MIFSNVISNFSKTELLYFKNPTFPQHKMSDEEINREFYKDCARYLEALRESGKSDDAFEDEYYFTLPAISGSGMDW